MRTTRLLNALLAPAIRTLVLAAIGYATAALVGGAIPANRSWRPPASGVAIWVESNGIHTDLILPKVAGGIDWRDIARPQDLADPRYAGWDHVAIGWGEKSFFLETPRWRDVRPLTLLRAAIGSDRTLLHIEHRPAPAIPSDDVRRIVLRPEEYRRLAAFVRASTRPRGARYPGYDADDAFVDATGRYGLGRTCNEWTGAALRYAGVRVGWWTPLPISVLGWF